jgi:hypothetical protein
VDLNAQPVANDEQGRVVERQRIHHQLAQCGVQRLAGSFVFLSEVATLEHIGKTTLLPEGEHALFEQVVVSSRGRRYAKHRAQLDEMLLGALALIEAMAQASCSPFGDEPGDLLL